MNLDRSISDQVESISDEDHRSSGFEHTPAKDIPDILIMYKSTCI